MTTPAEVHVERLRVARTHPDAVGAIEWTDRLETPLDTYVARVSAHLGNLLADPVRLHIAEITRPLDGSKDFEDRWGREESMDVCLTPARARALAALLVRAAEQVEPNLDAATPARAPEPGTGELAELDKMARCSRCEAVSWD